MSATFGPAVPGRMYLKPRLKSGVYYNTKKPERTLGTTDLEEAIREYDKSMAKIPPKRGDIRNKEAFAFWIKNAGLGETTQELWQGVWGTYCARFLDGLLVSQVDVEKIIEIKNAAEAHVSVKTGRLVGPSRVSQVTTMLSSYFTSQTKLPTRYRDTNPVADLGNLRPARAKSKPVTVHEVLSKEQVELLVASVQLPKRARPMDVLLAKQMRLLIYVLAYGGMRIGEALALTLDDLVEDGNHGEWRIEKQVNRHRDLDRPSSWFVEVKTEKDSEEGTVGATVRFVPVMTPELRGLIDAYIAEGLEERWLRPGGLLFPTPKGTPRLVTSVDERFKAVREIAGLTVEHGRRKNTVIHHLRHTFASWLLESGEYSIEGIALLIGDSLQVCIDRYAHLSNRKLTNAKAVRAMAIRHGVEEPVAPLTPAASNVIAFPVRRTA
jgi:integrase